MIIKPHEINSKKLFVAGWYSDRTDICQEIIDYSAVAPDQFEGHISNVQFGLKPVVEKDKKDSTDCVLTKNPVLFKKYVDGILRDALEQYKLEYPEIERTNTKWGLHESTLLQHYKPNGGYKVMHYERSSGKFPQSHRFLVFMTYLNTVEDGGGTEFKYQNTTFKAEQGLTLIWPAEWTHTHRGIVSPTEHKWIVTGWFGMEHE